MLEKYIRFVKGVSVNKLGKTGVVLTTSSFIVFVILEIARMLGVLHNAYIGLINYLVFPALFVIGLILIPIAWSQRKKTTGKSGKELLSDQFAAEELEAGFVGSKVFLTIGIFSLINILFLLIVSSQMLSFMDEAEFCGTACHSVMNPEWTTYQQSPHAHVRCVQCHVGEGVDALIASKLNGAYQILSLTFHLYKQPIPTPVHQLRPARETCEKCHWPKKFYGSRLKTIAHFALDSASTPRYTTLNLKVDIGRGGEKAGIHWHISKKNKVRYASVNDERKEMIWIEVDDKNGAVKRYHNKQLAEYKVKGEEAARTMDCVDCHNRATHIYENPEEAVDLRLQQGLMDRSLPYLKRVALGALLVGSPTKEIGLERVGNHIRGFYRKNYPMVATAQMDKVDQAVKVVQEIYERNIHQGMHITWGSYSNFLGHKGNSGCFRCHNEHMVDDNGKTIVHDCTTCHSILALESPTPFKYLEPVQKATRDSVMHQYLHKEFLNSYMQRPSSLP